MGGIANTRMLRWKSGIMKKDATRNEYRPRKKEVVPNCLKREKLIDMVLTMSCTNQLAHKHGSE